MTLLNTAYNPNTLEAWKEPFSLFNFPAVFTNSERTCDKEFIIRRAATNRVLNVLRHWVSKHSQVRLCPPLCMCLCVFLVACFFGRVIKFVVSLKWVTDAFSLHGNEILLLPSILLHDAIRTTTESKVPLLVCVQADSDLFSVVVEFRMDIYC